jgi:hypothetical protein
MGKLKQVLIIVIKIKYLVLQKLNKYSSVVNKNEFLIKHYFL